jgi:hypothetical protein
VSKPLLVQHQARGTCYSLHHSAVHSDYAHPGTVSLVLTGPAKRDRFRVVDKRTGDFWYRYGVQDARYQPNRGQQELAKEDVARLRRFLTEVGVISGT